MIEELDAARDRAAVTQEELASRLAEQSNKRLYVLSVVAAVFLPLGLITGLLGVNLGGIPGTPGSVGVHHSVCMLDAVYRRSASSVPPRPVALASEASSGRKFSMAQTSQ